MHINPTLRILYTSNGTYLLLISSIIPLYALYAESLGADIVTVSQIAAATFVGKIVGLMVLSVAAQHTTDYVHKNLFILSLLLQGCIWFSLAFATTITHLFIAQLGTGLVYALGVPAFRSLVARHRDYKKSLYAYSTWELILAVTTSTGAVAGGVIVEKYGFSTLFLLISGVTLVIAIYAYFRLQDDLL